MIVRLSKGAAWLEGSTTLYVQDNFEVDEDGMFTWIGLTPYQVRRVNRARNKGQTHVWYYEPGAGWTRVEHPRFYDLATGWEV